MKLVKFMQRVLRRIPGFRRMSSNSMVIAITYYGAAILTMAMYWYWGLILISLPFLIFYLLDVNIMGNRKLCLFVSIAAGVLVLLGTAGGLSAAGSGAKPVHPSFAAESPQPSAPSATPVLEITEETSIITESPLAPAETEQLATAAASASAVVTASASAAATAAPITGPASYVGSKNTKVFHRPDCGNARRIKPANLVRFKTRKEAVARGRRACEVCKP